MAAKANPIWEFFDRSNADESKAVCKSCKGLISLGSKQRKFQTTSAMIKHLKTQHTSIFEQMEQKKEVSKSKKEAVTASSQSASSSSLVLHQTSLEESFAKPRQWEDKDPRSVRTDRLILEMIIQDCQPFSMVTDKGFARLLQDLKPQYRIKSDKFYRDKLDEFYSEVVQKLQVDLEAVQWVSCTSDAWSNEQGTCALLGMTGHFIDYKSGTRKSVVLSAVPLEESHTASYLSNCLSDEFGRWGLESKLHLMLRDNARNMEKAMRDNQWPDLPCFNHTLALVVKDALEVQRVVVDLLAKCRAVVSHFHHSPTAFTKLNVIQKELGLPEHRLKQEVKTRWNATVDCVERLLEQKEAIALYSVREKSIPSDIQWEIAEKFVFLLAKFREATQNAQKADACVSVIIPLCRSLINFLEADFPEKRGLGSMCDGLLKGIKQRFGPVFNRKETVVATLLDPRFKSTCFTERQLLQAKAFIVSELELAPMPPSPKRPCSTPSGDSSLWNFLSSTAAAEPADQQAEQALTESEQEAHLNQELSVYLGTPPENFSVNIYHFWSEQLAFKNLRKLAERFLSAPPTSAPAECLFSDAGRLYDERRSRLLPANAQKMLFLMNNLQLNKYISR